jgi:hypothetical protein
MNMRLGLVAGLVIFCSILYGEPSKNARIEKALDRVGDEKILDDALSAVLDDEPKLKDVIEEGSFVIIVTEDVAKKVTGQTGIEPENELPISPSLERYCAQFVMTGRPEFRFWISHSLFDDKDRVAVALSHCFFHAAFNSANYKQESARELAVLDSSIASLKKVLAPSSKALKEEENTRTKYTDFLKQKQLVEEAEAVFHQAATEDKWVTITASSDNVKRISVRRRVQSVSTESQSIVLSLSEVDQKSETLRLSKNGDSKNGFVIIEVRLSN